MCVCLYGCPHVCYCVCVRSWATYRSFIIALALYCQARLYRSLSDHKLSRLESGSPVCPWVRVCVCVCVCVWVCVKVYYICVYISVTSAFSSTSVCCCFVMCVFTVFPPVCVCFSFFLFRFFFFFCFFFPSAPYLLATARGWHEHHMVITVSLRRGPAS